MKYLFMSFKAAAMVRSALLCSILLSVWGTSNLRAESPWILVDGHEAHPTKIMARLKEPAHAALRHAELTTVIKNSGSVVSRNFKGIPGLMVLDALEQGLAPRAERQVDKEIQAEELLDRIDFLKASGRFEYVEPNYIRQLTADVSDPAYADGRLWGLKNTGQDGGQDGADIDVDLAWDITVGSKDVVVAVIDTGIRYTHQELNGNMWVNEGETPDNGLDDDFNGVPDDLYGYNAVLQNGDPLDVEDHGTNVASVIGAESNDKDVVGVAQAVQLMALKGLGPMGGEDADLVSCIEYAVFNEADIINASWGGGAYSQSVFDAIALAQKDGILFVAAAGNEGSNNDIFAYYPSNYDLDNILSVASMDRHDLLADHSNYGSKTVDIAAPGREIYMAGSGDEASNVGTGSSGTTVDPDEDYDLSDGTSFAAPHVSGVAVLLKSMFPESEAPELKEMILSSAVKSPAYLSKVSTGGRLNAYQALQVDPDGVLEVSLNPPSRSVLLQGEPQAIVVRVTDLIGIADATVTGTSSTGETIVFGNEGQDPDVKAGDALYTAGIVLPGLSGDFSITLRVEAPGKIPADVEVNYTLVPPPPNDAFSDAIKVDPSGGAYFTNSKFATMEEGEPLHDGTPRANSSLWWSWSPASSGAAIIDSAGSDFDTIIAVYDGNTLEELVPLASVDQVAGRDAGYLEFDVIAGKSYRIAVASYGAGRGGTLRLRIEPEGLPDITPPVVKISAPADGLIVTQGSINVTGYAFDPEPGAYGIKEIILKVNGELSGGSSRGTSDWESPAYLNPGLNTIKAQAVDFAGNRSDIDKIFVTYIQVEPANDHFSNAEIIVGVQGNLEGSTADASKEAGEPNHAGNEGGRSVWFRYTPEEDGTLDITLRRVRFDSLMAFYQVPADVSAKVKDLDDRFVASNDDSTPQTAASRIVQALEAGLTYWIAVDGFGGEGGDFGLRYQFTASALQRIEVDASTGGTVDGPVGLVATGSELILTAKPETGHVFVGWTGAVESSDNPLSLVADADKQVSATFAPVTVSDDFESGVATLKYDTDGAAWTVTDSTSFSGNYALRSGNLGDEEASTLSLRQSFLGGRGKFDIKVSTEEGWDMVTFLMDGVVVQQWSGERDWQRYEFDIPAGEHVLEWSYAKDFANTSGDDAVYIDNVDLPLGAFESAAKTASVYVSHVGDGNLEIEVQGQPGADYVVEASKGLHKWQEVYRGTTDMEGRMQVRQVTTGGKAQSFFRARSE
jgi:subtilisin family serine protease